ncbi:MAG: Ig-like domain-containing protein [Patescibacteria group bacterium]|jgi:hypothetical protein
MKKIVSLVIGIIFFSSFNIAYAANVSLSISGAGSHDNGTEFDVSINVGANGNNVCAVRANLNYPSNLLDVVSVVKAGPSSAYLEIDNDTTTAGVVKYLGGFMNCTTSDKPLYIVKFRAKAAGSGQFSFGETQVVGGSGENTVALGFSKSTSDININQVNSSVSSSADSSGDGSASSSSSASGDSSSSSSDSSSSSTDSSNTSGSSASTDSNSRARNSNTNNQNSNTTPVIVAVNPYLKTVVFSSDASFDTENKKVKGFTFSGTAEPDSKVYITIMSFPILAEAQTNSSGVWSFSITNWLEDGDHTLTAYSEKNGIKSAEIKVGFTFQSADKNSLKIISASVVNKNSNSNNNYNTNTNSTASAETNATKSNFWTILMYITLAIVAVIVVFLVLIIRRNKNNNSINPTADINNNPVINPNPVNNVESMQPENQISEEKVSTEVYSAPSVISEPVETGNTNQTNQQSEEPAIITPSQAEDVTKDTKN